MAQLLAIIERLKKMLKKRSDVKALAKVVGELTEAQGILIEWMIKLWEAELRIIGMINEHSATFELGAKINDVSNATMEKLRDRTNNLNERVAELEKAKPKASKRKPRAPG